MNTGSRAIRRINLDLRWISLNRPMLKGSSLPGRRRRRLRRRRLSRWWPFENSRWPKHLWTSRQRSAWTTGRMMSLSRLRPVWSGRLQGWWLIATSLAHSPWILSQLPQRRRRRRPKGRWRRPVARQRSNKSVSTSDSSIAIRNIPNRAAWPLSKAASAVTVTWKSRAPSMDPAGRQSTAKSTSAWANSVTYCQCLLHFMT